VSYSKSGPSRRNERGVVIIWTAFFLLFMLGFVAIGIDVAKLMATRTQLQNAADAAALAGVSAVSPLTGQLMPDTAVARAQETALRNKAFQNAPTPITLLSSDVEVDPAERTVRATVRRSAASDGPMITHIAQVLGIKNMEVKATATAKAEMACRECEKLVPLGAIPPVGSNGFEVNCLRTYLLLEGQGGGINGNYKALSFPDCDEGACGGQGAGGAATLGCLIEHGYACCVGVGDLIQTKPGQNAGQVVSGLQARWDRDTDCTPNICYSLYRGNGSRVINVPVVESLGAGRTDVRVVSLAAFFLKVRPASPGLPVPAEFVYDVVPGNGGNCVATVFTIRLIQ
jgi:Flp pilus assembly protein TadG